MFRMDRPGLCGPFRAKFRGMPNRSMVPWQVHGGTILLPVCPGCATSHSHYCECLYKSPVGNPSALHFTLFHQPFAEAFDALQALLDVRHIGASVRSEEHT